MNDDLDEHRAELDWLVFRYVVGEMAGAEARAFEQQMSVDQAAREAVSRAVALGLQLAAARPVAAGAAVSEAHGSRRSGRFRDRATHALGWAAVGMAASLAIWFGSRVVRIGGGGLPGSQPPPIEAPQLAAADALAWVQLRDLDNTVLPLELGRDELEPDDSSQLETGHGPVVPSWVVELAIKSAGEGKK